MLTAHGLRLLSVSGVSCRASLSTLEMMHVQMCLFIWKCSLKYVVGIECINEMSLVGTCMSATDLVYPGMINRSDAFKSMQ